ncbi:hypothetical protein RHECIAT_CH0004349 [Rhizobium etli CIAT 652]|uniref:Uncharacterized protein n=1 Tax=Rhizobium etli (strain CIAT 652) TaxID=491916 RepID=B3PRY7_RHIE6|nr:hypothetical protein RHECIAT_CH0004349 [Rhizobium etli CIAT 652]
MSAGIDDPESAGGRLLLGTSVETSRGRLPPAKRPRRRRPQCWSSPPTQAPWQWRRPARKSARSTTAAPNWRRCWRLNTADPDRE